MKYTVFINSLIVSLRNSSNFCCIYWTPRTPVGYADDLATCSLSKTKLDKTLEVVYNHGCSWHYNLQA